MKNKKDKHGTRACTRNNINNYENKFAPCKRSAPACSRNYLNYEKKFVSCKRSAPACSRNYLNYEKKFVSCKRSQEEMVGFALIIILVSIILLVFLAISLNKPKTETESYEVNSFLQSTLQYTTACQTSSGIKKFNTIQDLVFECDLKNKCYDEEDTCKVLNETLTGLLKESWPTEEDSPNKGYGLTINTREELILNILEGNLTKSCKGSSQSFSKSRTKKDFTINFKVCD